jgi:acyl-coenzyme A thioesterase PaaI-like protein
MMLNDRTEYQQCYACGMRNAHGLHMEFRIEGDTIVSDFQPETYHQGFPGVLHGGIVSALMDEVLNRTSLLADHPQWTMTGRLEIRFRRQVPCGPLLRLRAKLDKQRGRMFQASGTLTLVEDESIILVEGQGAFMALSDDMVQSLLQEYPGFVADIEGEEP